VSPPEPANWRWRRSNGPTNGDIVGESVTLHLDLHNDNTLVGIIRNAAMSPGAGQLTRAARSGFKHVLWKAPAVQTRWHLAVDLRNMAAGHEWRGQGPRSAHREPLWPHPDDHPSDDPNCWPRLCSCAGPRRWAARPCVPNVPITREDQVPMLRTCSSWSNPNTINVEKYFTPDERANPPARRS